MARSQSQKNLDIFLSPPHLFSYLFLFLSNPHPLLLIEKYLKIVVEKNSNELCNGHMLSHQILMFTVSDVMQKIEGWDCAGNDPSSAEGF